MNEATDTAINDVPQGEEADDIRAVSEVPDDDAEPEMDVPVIPEGSPEPMLAGEGEPE